MIPWGAFLYHSASVERSRDQAGSGPTSSQRAIEAREANVSKKMIMYKQLRPQPASQCHFQPILIGTPYQHYILDSTHLNKCFGYDHQSMAVWNHCSIWLAKVKCIIQKLRMLQQGTKFSFSESDTASLWGKGIVFKKFPDKIVVTAEWSLKHVKLT